MYLSCVAHQKSIPGQGGLRQQESLESLEPKCPGPILFRLRGEELRVRHEARVGEMPSLSCPFQVVQGVLKTK